MLISTSRKNDQEAAEGYLKIAKTLGFDLTIDEIVAGLKAAETKTKVQSDKVSLDDDDLESVAGGLPGDYHGSICASTYTEDEWCWFSDSCSYVVSEYEDNESASKNNNSNGCTFTDLGPSAEDSILSNDFDLLD